MKVYYNGFFLENKKDEEELKELRIGQNFKWDQKEGKILAIYTGGEGIVMDSCIRILPEKMEAFLTKWNQEKRLSDLSDEEFEEMERENPCYVDFSVDVSIDGKKLSFDRGCQTAWHPLKLESGNIGRDARRLMEEYGCSKDSGWLFERRAYRFEGEEITEPHTLKLHFHQNPQPYTGSHFVTEEGMEAQTFPIRHPLSKEEYQLTLYGMEARELGTPNHPGKEEYLFPGNYYTLSYDTNPKLPKDTLQIQDVEKSDSPTRIENGSGGACAISVIGGEDGPTAFFAAGKRKEKTDTRKAYSALHFSKKDKVNWRTVFYEKTREDFELEILLK